MTQILYEMCKNYSFKVNVQAKKFSFSFSFSFPPVGGGGGGGVCTKSVSKSTIKLFIYLKYI